VECVGQPGQPDQHQDDPDDGRADVWLEHRDDTQREQAEIQHEHRKVPDPDRRVHVVDAISPAASCLAHVRVVCLLCLCPQGCDASGQRPVVVGHCCEVIFFPVSRVVI